jgi:hypothetical protein
VRKALQLVRLDRVPLLSQDSGKVGPVVSLHVRLRAPTESFVGPDHDARRFLDVLGGRHGPEAGNVPRGIGVPGCADKRRAPAAVIE